MPRTTVMIDDVEVTCSSNVAGYFGVIPTKDQKWQAKVTLESGGGQVVIGTYDIVQEAAKAAAIAVRDFNAGTWVPEKKRDQAPRGSKRLRYAQRAEPSMRCALCSSVCCLSFGSGTERWRW